MNNLLLVLQAKFGSSEVTYEKVKAVYDSLDLDGDGIVTVPEAILHDIDIDGDGIVRDNEHRMDARY